uniref:Uncharacterized protein n=1 Tax=Chrysotila carterae TaxID=13221 RepID=A0A7S4AYP3_CHRCT
MNTADLHLTAKLQYMLSHGADTRDLHEFLKASGIGKLGPRLSLICRARERPAADSLHTLEGRPLPILPVELPSARLSVALVGHSGYFSGLSYGGATRASLSLIRELRRQCGDNLELVALAQRPMPEGLVYKLIDARVGTLPWEGSFILVGDEESLANALKGRQYDLVISLTIEESVLRFAHSLSSNCIWAMAHNYYLPPFGPFCRVTPTAEHVQLLHSTNCILSPCQHHADFLQRWCPVPSLRVEPLFAADYNYFHLRQPDGTIGLPPSMRPWECTHRFVTLVSPCPAKGLSVLLALAERNPSIDFAAVPTQWTDELSRNMLAGRTNITVLEPHEDVGVILGRTRVLLAPSLWQECCPLIVMEATLRGVPCVSSDVFGVPEANKNTNLVVPTSLCFDHARGLLLHGTTNAELEQKLGRKPPLISSRDRKQNFARAVREIALEDEVAPFENVLLPLLRDEEILRRESSKCRSLSVDFAEARQDNLAAMLHALALDLPCSAVDRPGLLDSLSNRGIKFVQLNICDLQQQLPAGSAEPPLHKHFSSPACYRVLHRPYVLLRAAPSVMAEVLSIAPHGQSLYCDAELNGWVRLSATALEGHGAIRRMWALVDGAALGLGLLLQLL